MNDEQKSPTTHIIVNEVQTKSGKVYSNFAASLSPDKETGFLKGTLHMMPVNGEITVKPIEQRLKNAEAGVKPHGQTQDRDIER